MTEPNNLNGIDFDKLIEESMFDSGFILFSDYLETIVAFLEKERQGHNESIDEINKSTDLDELGFPNDPHRIPPQIEYEYYQLDRIADFENTLFSSFFVTIYFYLESELTRHCHDLAKQHQEMLSLSDIVGNGVQRAVTYLIKVQHIEFSLGNSREWEKIQNYNILRNCIVHNQGKLDESFEKGSREKLLKFIEKPNSKLQLSNTWCVLNKDFCLEALSTIKTFLHSVIFAKIGDIRH
jgi:hypothetical protein